MRHLAALTAIAALLSSCATRDVCIDPYSGDHSYSTRAYLEYKERRKAEEHQAFDQPQAAPALLDLSECDVDARWERQPYETIEQWHERIRCELCSNNSELIRLEEEQRHLISDTQERAEALHQLVAANQQLRSMLQNMVDVGQPSREYRDIALKPQEPFIVHVVKPGQTLYSIAMHYYDDPDMVSAIIEWNQGWIRSPEEMPAGIGLVLFENRQVGGSSRLIDQYVSELRRTPPQP